MSDASGTAWLDVGARAWSPELLAESELSTDHMPRLVEGSATSGTLRAEIASEFGLPAGIPVAGGGGDNAAAAIGMGVTDARLRLRLARHLRRGVRPGGHVQPDAVERHAHILPRAA